MTCHATDPSAPACAEQVTRQLPDGDSVETTSRMARYPQVFYLVTGLVMRVSLALGAGGSTALLLARVTSGLWSMLMIWGGAAMARRQFGLQPALVSTAVVLTPSFLFLSSSINPNGLEIASAYALAASGVALLSQARDKREYRHVSAWGRAFFVLSALILGFVRPASVLWLGLILLTLLICLLPQWRKVLRRLGVVTIMSLVMISVGSLLWFAYTNRLRGAGVVGTVGLEEWGEIPLLLRLWLILLKFGEIITNGYGTLGWLDTEVPALFPILWLIVGTFSITRLVSTRTQRTTFFSPNTWLAWSFFIMCALTVALQSNMTAFGWQGRYFTPAVVAFVAFLLPSMETTSSQSPLPRPGSYEVSSSAPPRGRNWIGVGYCMLASGLGLISLRLVMLRYMYGYTHIFARFDSLPIPHGAAEWAPIGGLRLISIFGATGCICLVMAVGLLTLWSDRPRIDHRVPTAPTPQDQEPLVSPGRHSDEEG